MSYDIRLEGVLFGEPNMTVSKWFHPTYNLAPMFYEAMPGGLRSLEGKTGRDAAPTLGAAIVAMESQPVKFRAMNPKNGWGSYEGALSFLHDFMAECERHPQATVRV